MRFSFQIATCIACIYVVFAAPLIQAQDDSDLGSAFDNPAPDVTAPEPAKTTSTLDNFTAAKPISFRGTLNSGVGMIAGWRDWPNSVDAAAAIIPSGYFSFSNTLAWDARLNAAFSFSASIVTTYPGTTTLLSTYLSNSSALPTSPDSTTLLTVYPPFSLSIGEMFFDYSIADKLFFRIGKQNNTWGNERIFSLTNLISDGAAGLAIKGYIPFGGAGITAVILDQSAWHPDSTYPGFHTLAYLGKLDLIVGKVELQASARYRSAEGEKTVAALKTTFFGIDLFHESMLSFAPSSILAYTTVSGFYWQGADSDIQIYGEYAYIGNSGYGSDNRMSIATQYDLGHFLEGKARIGIKWDHAFADSSGSILPAIDLLPLPYVSLKIGFPILYGAADSIYVASSGDPSSRRESVVIAATISVNY